LLIFLPWYVNGSNGTNNIAELSTGNIGDFQSTACEFSFFEFLTKNINSSFSLEFDNPSSINCFSKINSADYLNDQNVVYVGTNLNLDLIIQSAFWLLLLSLIPKDKRPSKLDFKNSSILIALFLLFLHFISEGSFYNMNSKNFSTSIESNYLLYSLLLTFFIVLKVFSILVETRINNLLYFLPFLFIVSGAFNSSNLNIFYICLMFVGISVMLQDKVYKILVVINLIITYLWISYINQDIQYFDVDKLKGFNSSSYNQNSIFYWSMSLLFVVFGFLYICKVSLKNIELNKLKINFLTSGVLVIFFSLISAFNPVINFFTYYYFGLNKTASKTFDPVAGNAWRGISPSAEAIGEFFAFIVLFTLFVTVYKKAKLSILEICLLLVNLYGLYKSNNFAAATSMLVVIVLFFIFLKIKNQKTKYTLVIFTILFFPIIYFSYFNSYDFNESSRKLIKEGFTISNIEYLDTNEFGRTPIDDNRFYEVILNTNSKDKISTSLNFLVEEYHFSDRNGIPNITTIISSIATPINRSEKWGIFFGKYNPSFETFLFGTGSINLADYYFGHASKANFGLILPHSSILSYLIFFGVFGLILLLVFIFSKFYLNKDNIYYVLLNIYFLINLLKSDSLLYLNSFLLFLLLINSNKIFKHSKVQ
tara:strand:- start:5068 stop:7017 length:1950 start_codon:yes stop_codon:yes gene_type:complete